MNWLLFALLSPAFWGLNNVFNKVGVGSRTEAVIYALRKGWITLEDTV